jgi:uncharacterized protein YlxW (UPF0749 family)
VATGLAVILGFGIVTTWRASHSSDVLTTARPDQLLSLLDNLAARQHRLQEEQERLAVTREKLVAGSQKAALSEAQVRLNALRVLAGTTSVKGPGVIVRINDPDYLIPASMVLDTVQELRDAGAEAISINQVRVVANSWVADSAASGILVNGTALKPPYTVAAIGDGRTMAVAMRIPGGVTDALKVAGATVRVSASKHLTLAPVKSTR